MPNTGHQLVRYKAGKNHFEVLVKVGAAAKYRRGLLGLDNTLFSDDIFKNSAKGDKANSAELTEAFGTDKSEECIKIILEKGDIQLTAAERKEAADQRRKEIVNYIHKYYIDPKSKLPHPVTRIENALDELKIHVDGDTPVEKQVLQILKALPDVMPIKKCEVTGTLKIPHVVLAQCTGIISKYATVEKENYDSEGCTMSISMVPGDYDTFIKELQHVAKGDFQFEIDGHAAMATTEEPEAKGKGKGKGKGKQKH